MKHIAKLAIVNVVVLILSLTVLALLSKASALAPTITSIQAGGYHTCALTSTGGVKCWGSNGSGQLGTTATFGSAYPLDVPSLTSGVISLAVGGNHSCVVVTGGAVKCWGRNIYGQLGDGTSIDRFSPVDVVGLSAGVVSVVAGEDHSCALLASGGVKCWGYNSYGQLGCGYSCLSGQVSNVYGLSSGVTALAAGSGHTCALMQTGEVQCWGAGYSGQLGNGYSYSSDKPVYVSNLSSYGKATSITAGSGHTCAIMETGDALCWGSNMYGQLSTGTGNTNIPMPVINLSRPITSLSAGWNHTCAMTLTGVYCWGYNSEGEVGDSTNLDYHWTPFPVPNMLGGVTLMDGGKTHTCAVTSSGVTRCWGGNPSGQVGNGTYNAKVFTPTDVVWDIPLSTLSGYVRDSNSSGIAGVTIQDGKGHVVTTAADGSYSFTNLTFGIYSLTPSKSGYNFNPISSQMSVPPSQTGINFTGTAIVVPQVDLDVAASKLRISVGLNQGKSDQPVGTLLEYDVKNNGTVDANNVQISFFDGPPGNGKLLMVANNGIVKAGKTATFTRLWTAPSNPAQANIYLQVKDLNITDSNPTNNTTSQGTPVFTAFAGNLNVPYRYDPDTFNFANWTGNAYDFLDQLKYYTFRLDSLSQQIWQRTLGPLAYIFLGQGNCFGMSQASIMYWDTPQLKPMNANTFTMDKSVVAPDIRDLQVRQVLTMIPNSVSSRLQSLTGGVNLNSYSAIKERLTASSPRPAILAGDLTAPGINGGKTGAHAVVAYKVVEIGSEKYVFIYDNNSPLPNPISPSYPLGADILQLDLTAGKFLYINNPTQYFSTAIISDPIRTPDDVTVSVMRSSWQALLRYLAEKKLTGLFFTWAGQPGASPKANAPSFPTNFQVTNTQGQSTGYIGNTLVNDIPGAEFYDVESGYYLLVPSNGTYQMTTYGTGFTNYTFSVAIPKDSSSVDEIDYSGFTLPIGTFTASEFGPSTTDWRIFVQGQPDVLPSNHQILQIDQQPNLGYQNVFLPLTIR